MTKNDRHHLPYMVKKANQETLVLVTHTDGEGHHAVDATLETGRSINALLEKIGSMYPQQVRQRPPANSRSIQVVVAVMWSRRLARALWYLRLTNEGGQKAAFCVSAHQAMHPLRVRTQTVNMWEGVRHIDTRCPHK